MKLAGSQTCNPRPGGKNVSSASDTSMVNNSKTKNLPSLLLALWFISWMLPKNVVLIKIKFYSKTVPELRTPYFIHWLLAKIATEKKKIFQLTSLVSAQRTRKKNWPHCPTDYGLLNHKNRVKFLFMHSNNIRFCNFPF